MSIEAILRVLNDLQATGALGEYAIGGAVAAFLYLEPATTFDLDIFIRWTAGPGGLLSPAPIYGRLAEMGYREYQNEAIVVEGWAVQFLPLGTPLVEEALAEAVLIAIKAVPTRVFTKEHLMAICLQTGRPKDLARLVQFVQESSPDMKRFEEIVNRHGLAQIWRAFHARYLTPL